MKQGDEGEEKRPISLIRLAIFGNVVAQQRPEQKASPYSLPSRSYLFELTR
jgi:hypothetical protein